MLLRHRFTPVPTWVQCSVSPGPTVSILLTLALWAAALMMASWARCSHCLGSGPLLREGGVEKKGRERAVPAAAFPGATGGQGWAWGHHWLQKGLWLRQQQCVGSWLHPSRALPHPHTAWTGKMTAWAPGAARRVWQGPHSGAGGVSHPGWQPHFKRGVGRGAAMNLTEDRQGSLGAPRGDTGCLPQPRPSRPQHRHSLTKPGAESSPGPARWGPPLSPH